MIKYLFLLVSCIPFLAYGQEDIKKEITTTTELRQVVQKNFKVEFEQPAKTIFLLAINIDDDKKNISFKEIYHSCEGSELLSMNQIVNANYSFNLENNNYLIPVLYEYISTDDDLIITERINIKKLSDSINSNTSILLEDVVLKKYIGSSPEQFKHHPVTEEDFIKSED